MDTSSNAQGIPLSLDAPDKRVMQKKLLDYFCAMIGQAAEHYEQVNVAIDGMCGAGKSTLGEALAARLDGNLFHMDDFFLRPEQRTPKRYAQPGGNVDYERFRTQIGDHLSDEKGLVFQPFDCRRMMLGKEKRVPYKRVNIVEGAYSCHPYFGEIWQIRLFAEISSEEQKRRILARNGAEMLRRFEQEWIPMENRYFAVYEIRKKCVQFRTDTTKDECWRSL